MKITSLVLTIAWILALGVPAVAHHSFSGTYILDRTATIEGTIVQFDIRNPHSYVTIELKAADGKTVRWGVEWGGVTLLAATGISKQTLRIGDKVSVTGAPARDPGEHKVLMQKIDRSSDGWNWGYRPEEVIKGYTFSAPAAITPTPAAR